MFLYIVPLKQGLKLKKEVRQNGASKQFLYIVPLKQGLKLSDTENETAPEPVFIHSSIKTRIETTKGKILTEFHIPFLYIVPLKQGLKLIS